MKRYAAMHPESGLLIILKTFHYCTLPVACVDNITELGRYLLHLGSQVEGSHYHQLWGGNRYKRWVQEVRILPRMKVLQLKAHLD